MRMMFSCGKLTARSGLEDFKRPDLAAGVFHRKRAMLYFVI